jgi:hypothetical protein
MRTEVKVAMKPKSKGDIVTLYNYPVVGTKEERRLQILEGAKLFNQQLIANNPELLDEWFELYIVEED